MLGHSAEFAISNFNRHNFELGAGIVEQATDGSTDLLQPLSNGTEPIDQAFASMAHESSVREEFWPTAIIPISADRSRVSR